MCWKGVIIVNARKRFTVNRELIENIEPRVIFSGSKHKNRLLDQQSAFKKFFEMEL